MKVDLYNSCVRVFDRGLAGLSVVLQKGVAYAAENSISEAELLDSRLHPNMYPLYRQAQIVCDFARQAPSRVLELEVPVALEGVMTAAELQAQIASAREWLRTLKREQFEGRDERVITWPLNEEPTSEQAGRFLQGFATPNFYFHLMTAYCILRQRGVPLGKVDYFGVGR